MKNSRSAKPIYHVPALEKALDVLEALAASSVPQSLADLARALNRTSSELFRMLTVLERRNYVLRDPLSGSYSLSLRLYELGHSHSPVERMVRVASRPMRELADNVRESCHLSVLNRGSLVILMQMESPEKLRLSIEVGARFPALHTSSGRLLLAYLPERELEDFLESDSEAQALSRSERNRLRAQLREIRQTGYAVAESESRAGMKDLVVLAGNPDIGVTAALAVPCLLGGRDEKDVKRILTALQACAWQITRTLGLKADQKSHGG
jgi:DNA-binding IclR family transcriptional regulator